MKRLLCCLLILSAPLCDAQQPQGRAPAKSPNVPDGITYSVQQYRESDPLRAGQVGIADPNDVSDKLPIVIASGTPNIGACNAKRGELTSAQADASLIRSFTSKDGRSIKASLLAKESNKVSLRRSDGQQFDISIDNFSANDQRYVENYFQSLR